MGELIFFFFFLKLNLQKADPASWLSASRMSWDDAQFYQLIWHNDYCDDFRAAVAAADADTSCQEADEQ